MSPIEFKNNWTNTVDPLCPLSKSRLERFDLKKKTFDFLNIAGLPTYCEPNLSFANDTDDIFYGISKLTEQYDYLLELDDFEEGEPTFDKYVIIGSCRDGDVIAIDTTDDDKIVELDHEDSFSAMYFNSSVETLAHFLILYSDFETEVLEGKNPEDNLQCYNFTDKQFERLKSQMFSVDSSAMTEAGFWKDELEILLSLRKDNFPGT